MTASSLTFVMSILVPRIGAPGPWIGSSKIFGSHPGYGGTRAGMDGWIMPAPSPLLDAALSILADGKPRSAAEIFAEGQRRGLFAHETRKRIYTALSQYIQRTVGRGFKPLFVQDPDRRFRINRPADDWPSIDTTGLPPLAAPSEPPPEARAALAALHAASTGADSDAFERAVCGAFEIFGFAATHVGGNAAPDGYADALLGELGYRVTIECKLSGGDHVVGSASVAEAAKYREPYRADVCALVAPAFAPQVTFDSEMHAHGVSAWTVGDLVRAATLRLDCWDLRACFAPGYAAGPLENLAWAKVAGAAKHLRVTASLILEMGLAQQRMARTLGDPASAPRMSVDVALSLIDDRLSAAGSTRGVTREEVAAAFTWLTSPYVARALWVDEQQTAIVVRPVR